MILGRNDSSSIIQKIESLTGIICPWELNKIESWTFQVLAHLQGNPLLGITSSDELLKARVKKFPGETESRLSATWIGSPSPFFGKKHYKEHGSRIIHNTVESRFYLLEDVSIYNFYEFGPIVFDEENNVIEELSTPFYRLVLLEDDFPKRFEHIVKPVCALSDRFNEANYAHWLLDSIPRIRGKVLMESESDEVNYLCHQVTSDWQNDMLSHFSVAMEKRIQLEPRQLYKFRKIVLPDDFGRAVMHPSNKTNSSGIAKITENLKNCFSESFDILFIERNSNRRLINQDSIVEKLTNNGFRVKVIDCSRISFDKQRELFNEARIVIGVHGAALASSVFMQRGSFLFELLPQSYGNPAFWMVSSAKGVNYVGVTDLTETGENSRPRLKDIMVNITAIEKINVICGNVIKLIGNTTSKKK
ncbi:glycosyltransferase family 61 protein [Vibrio wakamikoensis]|uniref:glycosyltransferase family 61 protein n=1 Tax=Vibrio wakamikoensis TaxID=2910251 RepID=UPI003D19546C